MKLASLKGRPRRPAGGRVARSLALRRCVGGRADVAGRARRLGCGRPRLTEIADSLEAGRIAHMPFDPGEMRVAAAARAIGWADGSAYVNHVALVRQARGAEVPASFWTDPLMYQGGSDDFSARAIRSRRRRGLGHRSRSRGRRSSAATCRWARRARRPRKRDPADHAGQRCELPQPHPGRARQGLRLSASRRGRPPSRRSR